MDNKQLNIFGSLSRTGYGIATINIAKALHKLGVDLTLTGMGSVHVNTQEEKEFCETHLNKGKFFHHNATCLKIWHQFDLATHMGRGKYFAMPIFELNKFNDIEKHHLRFPDELLVCSYWAQEVLHQEINRTGTVVPLGVDPTIFYPASQSSQGVDTYQFLNIGKWEVRKGHDILGEVFSKAFTKEDDVALTLIPHNPFLSHWETNQWVNKLKSSPLGDKVFILGQVNTHHELANLMRSAHCGIFPSRAEGWNMELLEMMACGKPTITTNYSAHTEYCTKDNSYLIDIDELEDAHDGKWFFGQGQWAKIGPSQIDQMVEHMRYCYKNRPDNPAGVETSGRFTWEHSARKILWVM